VNAGQNPRQEGCIEVPEEYNAAARPSEAIAIDKLRSYGDTVVTPIVVFPSFGTESGLAEQMTIGIVCVGVLLAPGYLLRRLFAALQAQ